MNRIATRFLLPLGLVVILLAGLVLYRTYNEQRAHIRELMNQQASLAMEFEVAVRGHIGQEIRPVMEDLVEPGEFIPEAMSTSFVARSVFDRVRERFPDYILKFSSANPRNPANRAGPAEQRIIEYFETNPDAQEWTGEIEIEDRPYLAHFRARRMKESCLRCHGEPGEAPDSLLARYGDVAGFHRSPGEIAALDTIAIPLDKADSEVLATVLTESAVIVGVLVAFFFVIAYLFQRMVAARLSRMREHFEQLAMSPDAKNLLLLDVHGNDEIAGLTRSYNALAEKLRLAHVSLEKQLATERDLRENERRLRDRLDYVLAIEDEQKELTLTDLLSRDELQEIQDTFANATGMASLITDTNGRPFTRPSNFGRVCKLVHGTREGLARCTQYGREIGKRARREMKPIYEACNGCGLVDASAPIVVDGQHIGNWLIGQKRVVEPDHDQIRAYAKETGVDPDELRAAYEATPQTSLEQFEKTLDLLWLTADKLSTLAFNNLSLARDIAQRKKIEATLRDDEAFVKSMLEAMNVGVLVIDPEDHRIVELNEAARTLIGAAKDQIVGHECHGFVPAAERGKCPVTDLKQEVDTSERKLICSNGETIPVLKSVTPVKRGDRTFLVETLVDIRDRKRAEDEQRAAQQAAECANIELRTANMELEVHWQQLQAQQRELVELNRELQSASDAARMASDAKTNFLANMSHEIRTPMTAILGFNELVFEEAACCTKCPEQEMCEAKTRCREGVNTIRRNGEYLLQIINDILDISKIEAGRMEMEHIRISPIELINEVAALITVRTQPKGLAFELQYQGSIPATIETDPTRLRQILLNILGNAVKFTELGGVALVTSLTRASDGDDVLQFDVVDTGVGMTEGQVDSLFQAFTQADTSTTRKFGGTGLGLVISQRLATMLGGDVQVVDSVRGEGTRFRVTVKTGSLEGVAMVEDPANAPTGEQPVTAAAPRTPPKFSQTYRILLAEDGPDNQRLIRHLLKKAGAEVTVVKNGATALDAAVAADTAGTPFDVILMDMQMPVMDGYTATRALRERGYNRPIIALTAHAMEGDRQKCLDAGCDDYATKPVNRKELIATVERHAASIAQPADG